MKVGTKSILWGAHAFWFHPIVVLLAWRKLYKRWPRWWQLVAIFCHDLAYWGLPNIDGLEGKQHPFGGALLAARIVVLLRHGRWLRSIPELGEWGSITYFFSLLHSRDMAAQLGLPVSEAYAADKYSICVEPAWFYLLRTRLSGEIHEFRQHAIDSGHIAADATDRQWLDFYKDNVINRPDIKKLLK